jgi:antitoxin (DNA-binding transcriptional repressor) of toxin-antitoxin stability system
MMFHVKIASVRDLRQDFPRILAWLQAGEEVAITLRRQAIATLVPRPPPTRGRRPMPDVMARLRDTFGERVIPDEAVQELLDRDRGAY